MPKFGKLLKKIGKGAGRVGLEIGKGALEKQLGVEVDVQTVLIEGLSDEAEEQLAEAVAEGMLAALRAYDEESAANEKS